MSSPSEKIKAALNYADQAVIVLLALLGIGFVGGAGLVQTVTAATVSTAVYLAISLYNHDPEVEIDE